MNGGNLTWDTGIHHADPTITALLSKHTSTPNIREMKMPSTNHFVTTTWNSFRRAITKRPGPLIGTAATLALLLAVTLSTLVYSVPAQAQGADATLSALTVSPKDIIGFASDRTSYEVGVASTVRRATITPTTTDSNATVGYSGTDASGAAGHQVNLRAGRNTVTVTVTAEDGNTTETYTVNVNRGVTTDYGWKAADDFDGLIAASNTQPYGIWSNGITMWVTDAFDDKIYAYTFSDGSRDTSKDFDTLDAAGNTSPTGIWSDNTTMWVADNGDNKIYAYNLSTKARDTSKDFDTLDAAGNTSPTGIWSDNTTMWVADNNDHNNDKIYAYNLSTKARDTSKDFDTLGAAGNNESEGIWSDNTTMWVADNNDSKIYAYRMSTKARDNTRDFDTLHAVENNHLSGIWSDGTTMWAADNTDDKIYSYNLGLSSDADLADLQVDGAALAGFSPNRRYFEFIAPEPAEITVSARTADPYASASIHPPDSNTEMAGHQVSVEDSSEVVTITVTAQDGTRKYYAIRIPAPCHNDLGYGRVVLDRNNNACVILDHVIVAVADGYTVDQAATNLGNLSGWRVIGKARTLGFVFGEYSPDNLTLGQLDAKISSIGRKPWARRAGRDTLAYASGSGSGAGDDSTQEQTSAEENPPDAPINVSAVSHANGQITVQWDAPTNAGGDSITGYAVHWKTQADSWETTTNQQTIAETTHTIVGLDQNTRYDVRVTATNPIGDSLPSAEASTTARDSVPPQTVTAVSDGAFLRLTFQEMLDAGSPPAPGGFQVTINGATSQVISAAVTDSVASLEITPPAAQGDTVLVSYDPAAANAGTNAPIADTNGNQAERIDNLAVTNRTAKPIWSGTVTTGVDTKYLPNPSGFSFYGQIGRMSSRSLTMDEVEYTITILGYFNDAMFFGLHQKAPADFIIRVGDAEYAAHDAAEITNTPSYIFWWPDQKFTWTAGDTVPVSIRPAAEKTSGLELPEAPPTVFFKSFPEQHDGAETFSFRMAFTPTAPVEAQSLIDAIIVVEGGDATEARAVAPGSTRLWHITVKPDGEEDITITLQETTNCEQHGAICAADGRRLHNRPLLVVPFVAPQAQAEPANEPATGAPTITGSTVVGQTLTAGISGIADTDGIADTAFTYQWLRLDGLSESNISGATGSSYTLTDADEGKTIRVRVSFTDDAGNAETVTSTATATVEPEPQAENSPATGQPSISGTAQVGETLTAGTTAIADSDGTVNATFTYQWVRFDGLSESNISGGTSSSYTLTDADEGKAIRVRVSFTDDAGNDEILTSAATATVEPEPVEPPAAPQNLTAESNNDGTITLTWNAPDDDSVTGYQILRRRPQEGENSLEVYVSDTGNTVTEYTDTDAPAGTRYVYRVKAINEAGAGGRSNYARIDH